MHYELPQLLARLRGLFEVAALPRAPEDRADALAAVAETIAEALEWGVVAINLVRPAWDDFEVVAVHGPPEAVERMLGRTSTTADWEPLFVERFYRRGSYRSDGDALFVPMRDSQGRLIGILSVEEPVDHECPGDEELDALVAVAAYAARAVESADAAAETIRHRRALERLLRVSSELTSARSVESLLASVCEAVNEALGFQHVVVELADRERDRYVPLAAAGAEIVPTHLELDTTIANLDALFDPEVELEGCYLLSREQALQRVAVEPTTFRSSFNGSSVHAWNRHWLIVPLEGRSGERLGFIWADDPEDRLLPSRPKLQALRMFANQAATAVESARQVADLERRKGELEALHETTFELIDRPTAGTLLETIVARACSLLETPNGYLYLRTEDPDELELAVALGIYGEFRGLHVDTETAVESAVFERVALGATMSFPLKVGNQAVGVLGVGYTEPGRTIDDAERALLQRFAQLASLALANARVYAALREQRDYSARLIESANAMVVGLDEEGRVEVFNHEAERVTGYRADELLGKNWFEVAVPRDRYPDAWATFARAIASGEIPSVYEGALLTKDGEERIVSWRNSSITVNGDLRGTISFGIDSTDVRRLEEELRQSQKMEAVGRLAGGIAHDFNNLLTAITGYGELALAKVEEPEVREHVFEMKRAGERAAALTKQLLAFSRRQVLQPEIVDPNATIADLEGLLDRLLGEQVELFTRLDPSVGRTKADPGQLQQVVMNLALNARDALSRGGRLTISTANATIDGVDYAEITVADDGTGMDHATLEQAFEPFFTTKPLGEGTGLGLATVYGIVKQSGGDVVASSTPGGGTTVRVLLPRADGNPVVADEQPADSEAPGTATILLVEDEEIVRKLVATMLDTAGYRVLEAESADQALAYADADEHVDVLLTDVVMPGLSGPELAEQLTGRWPALRVLFVSGYTSEAIERHGQISPGTSFLQKPFTKAQLTNAINELTIEPIVA